MRPGGANIAGQSLIIANEKRERYQCILDSTKAIFFFGTPHQGSDFADTALQSSPILKLFDSGAVEFSGGKGKLVRTELIQELSAKSETLDDLCSAFVERAHQVHHITTFYEVNKFRGSVVSTHHYLASVDPWTCTASEETHVRNGLFGHTAGFYSLVYVSNKCIFVDCVQEVSYHWGCERECCRSSRGSSPNLPHQG